METGEEARLAPQLIDLPSDASVSFLKRRLERISFGGHQLASSQQVCPAQILNGAIFHLFVVASRWFDPDVC